ncbi:hypothetical protein [Vibrio caribbeanicus]|uniref:hypothetical protein n=1 Tax=Vibrio caribbeanicus TaxID=701175 RepID=UPI0030DA7A51
MKLNNIALLLSLISLGSHAYEACEFGKEIRLLERNSLNSLKEENYLVFSKQVSAENLFSSPPDHLSDIKPSIEEGRELFPQTSDLLEHGVSSTIVLEPEQASQILKTLGRTSTSLTKGALESLGPIGDVVAVGLWSREVAQSFQDESRTAYDRFATVMELVDWFGILRLPEREIDRSIISQRWSSIASGDHYSFKVHQDLVTQNDLLEKSHWVDMARKQKVMLNAVVRGLASDVALKYQLHYQEFVKSQAMMSEELIDVVETELNKTLHHKLSLENRSIIASNFQNICKDEVIHIQSLYFDQDTTPTAQTANSALFALQGCQQKTLDNAVYLLSDIYKGRVPGFDKQAIQQLYTKTLAAKKHIAHTSFNNIERAKVALKQAMRDDGLRAIDKLFQSGAVRKAHSFFIDQASRKAVDELTRSLLYRGATPQELETKTIVLQKGYSRCADWGVLPGGDRHSIGCRQEEWVPAETRKFDPNHDLLISSQMHLPDQNSIENQFTDYLYELIANGWDAKFEEQWLEQQLIGFSKHQALVQRASKSRTQINHWLFDSNLGDECNSGCAGWHPSYLKKNGLSRQSSLDEIANWLNNYPYPDAPVHRKRIQKLKQFMATALDQPKELARDDAFYSYRHPGLFDIEKYAPLIASALKSSSLDITDLSGHSLTLAKSIVKSVLLEASEKVAEQGSDWLHAQVGDFQRYLAIAYSQQTSTGHYDPSSSDSLFSETLPAHILRYIVSDQVPDNYDQRLTKSINSLFDSSGSLYRKLETLTSVNRGFSTQPGQNCLIPYSQLKKRLQDVAGDQDLLWLTPFSDWVDQLTRQQSHIFEVIRQSVIKQRNLGIQCSLDHT